MYRFGLLGTSAEVLQKKVPGTFLHLFCPVYPQIGWTCNLRGPPSSGAHIARNGSVCRSQRVCSGQVWLSTMLSGRWLSLVKLIPINHGLLSIEDSDPSKLIGPLSSTAKWATCYSLQPDIATVNAALKNMYWFPQYFKPSSQEPALSFVPQCFPVM